MAQWTHLNKCISCKVGDCNTNSNAKCGEGQRGILKLHHNASSSNLEWQYLWPTKQPMGSDSKLRAAPVANSSIALQQSTWMLVQVLIWMYWGFNGIDSSRYRLQTRSMLHDLPFQCDLRNQASLGTQTWSIEIWNMVQSWTNTVFDEQAAHPCDTNDCTPRRTLLIQPSHFGLSIAQQKTGSQRLMEALVARTARSRALGYLLQFKLTNSLPRMFRKIPRHCHKPRPHVFMNYLFYPHSTWFFDTLCKSVSVVSCAVMPSIGPVESRRCCARISECYILHAIQMSIHIQNVSYTLRLHSQFGLHVYSGYHWNEGHLTSSVIQLSWWVQKQTYREEHALNLMRKLLE